VIRREMMSETLFDHSFSSVFSSNRREDREIRWNVTWLKMR